MEWFEDEEFWRELFPYMFPPERFACAPEQINQIISLTRFTGRTVLDLCCGPGRHSIELAQRGLQVTAVDRSAFLLKRARERAMASNVSVRWVLEDARSFVRPESFDLALNLFTSFGYFEAEEDNLRMLRNIYESLKPGGMLVMDMIGKEVIARRWKNCITVEHGDGALIVQRPQVRADWTRLRNSWTLIKDGHAKTFQFEHFLYSGREMKDRLKECGFDDVQIYGDLEGRAYNLDSLRLIVVAKKNSEA